VDRLGRHDASHRASLIGLIDTIFAPDAACWELGPDGEWTRSRAGADGVPTRDVQTTLIAGRAQQSAARRARMG
jgi:hypothetical protein